MQLWSRERVDALKATALVRVGWVMLARNAGPADATQAARELIGDRAEFSHLANGYPIYVIGA